MGTTTTGLKTLKKVPRPIVTGRAQSAWLRGIHHDKEGKSVRLRWSFANFSTGVGRRV